MLAQTWGEYSTRKVIWKIVLNQKRKTDRKKITTMFIHRGNIRSLSLVELLSQRYLKFFLSSTGVKYFIPIRNLHAV